MAEGDGVVYGSLKTALLNGDIDLSGDSTGHVIKTMLVKAAYTPDVDTDAAYADVSGNECSGTGYTATGETLASQSVAYVAGSNLAKFDGTDETWSSLNVSAGGDPAWAVMYDSTVDILMAYWEIATATNGGDWTLQWHANGIMTLS